MCINLPQVSMSHGDWPGTRRCGATGTTFGFRTSALDCELISVLPGVIYGRVLVRGHEEYAVVTSRSKIS